MGPTWCTPGKNRGAGKNIVKSTYKQKTTTVLQILQTVTWFKKKAQYLQLLLGRDMDKINV